METYQKELKGGKKSTQMPKEIEILMGKASHYFMFQEFHEATLILKEIIRKNPNYTEPYHLLGLMEGTFYFINPIE